MLSAFECWAVCSICGMVMSCACMVLFLSLLFLVSCSSSDTYQDGLVSSNKSLGDCSSNNGHYKDGYDHAKCIITENQNNTEAGAPDHDLAALKLNKANNRPASTGNASGTNFDLKWALFFLFPVVLSLVLRMHSCLVEESLSKLCFWEVSSMVVPSCTTEEFLSKVWLVSSAFAACAVVVMMFAVLVLVWHIRKLSILYVTSKLTCKSFVSDVSKPAVADGSGSVEKSGDSVDVIDDSISSTEEDEVTVRVRVFVVAAWTIMFVMLIHQSVYEDSIELTASEPYLNLLLLCQFNRGSNYTAISDTSGKIFTRFLDLVRISCIFIANIPFSLSRLDVLDTINQVPKSKAKKVRPYSAVNALNNRIRNNMVSVPTHSAVTACALVISFFLITSQFALVASESQSNSSTLHMQMCHPDEEPDILLDQCIGPQPEEICKAGAVSLVEHTPPRHFIPEFIRYDSSPKQLVSLTCLKTYKMHTANMNGIAVVLLCLAMFFLGPWAPLLLLVCVGVANTTVVGQCCQAFNRGARVLWDRGLVPMLRRVLDKAKSAANVTFSASIQARFFLPHDYAYLWPSLALCPLVVLCGCVTMLPDLLIPLDALLLISVASVLVLVLAGTCSNRVLGAANVGMNGAMWLFVVSATTAANVCGCILASIKHALSLIQAGVHLTLNVAVWLFRNVIQTFRLLFLAIREHALARNVQRDIRFMPMDIVLPALVRNLPTTLRLIDKGVLVQMADRVRDFGMPPFFDFRHLQKQRGHLYCLPDDYKAVVVNGTSITSEEQDFGGGPGSSPSPTPSLSKVDICTRESFVVPVAAMAGENTPQNVSNLPDASTSYWNRVLPSCQLEVVVPVQEQFGGAAYRSHAELVSGTL